MSKPHETHPHPTGGRERRSSPRKSYPHQILISTEGKAQGLIASDLSAGGMRVEACDTLQLGDELKLALYNDSRRPPVVVRAIVARDDRENGCHDSQVHIARSDFEFESQALGQLREVQEVELDRFLDLVDESPGKEEDRGMGLQVPHRPRPRSVGPWTAQVLDQQLEIHLLSLLGVSMMSTP